MGKSNLPAAPAAGQSAPPATFDGYRVAAMDAETVRDAIIENVGSGGATMSDLERLKVPGGGGRFWEMMTPEGVKPFDALECVILQWRDVRAYWAESLGDGDDASGGPPDCSSDDGVTGTGNPGGACETCPMAKFGSSHGGEGRGQACKSSKMVFFITRDDIVPRVLLVPPTSLRALRKFAFSLVNAQRAYWQVTTILGLDPKKNPDNQPYSEITFRAGSMLSPAGVERVKEIKAGFKSMFERAAQAEAHGHDHGDANPETAHDDGPPSGQEDAEPKPRRRARG